jgi:serine protease AprX
LAVGMLFIPVTSPPKQTMRTEPMKASYCTHDAAWQRHAAFWIVILTMASLAFGQSSKISPDLQALGPNVNANVIVQYYNPPNSNDLKFAKSVGAANGKSLGLANSYRWTTSPAKVQQLISQDTNIKYVSVDRPLKGAMNFAVPAVNADVAHNLGYDGTGIGVAVIDSGVNPVFDLTLAGASKTSRIVYSQNFDPSANTTSDLYGHGTHVAGIIAGNGGSSSCGNCDVTFRGIAPNVDIINLRVLDSNGSATDSTAIAAIQQAIMLKSQYNIRVINLSLGRGIFESYTLDPLCQAVEQAWQAGIVVVVAAGNYGRDNSNNNYGYGRITAPGNDPYVITVGAMKTMGTATRVDDLIATYSSKGPTMLDQIIKPDIVAPGNLVVSDLASTNATLYVNYPQNLLPLTYYTTSNNQNTSSNYYVLSGTSMAAPMVSGAAALLLQQNPLLTPDQVKARLMKTAYKTFPSSSSYTDPSTGITYTDYYDIFTIGAGYLDVWAALNNVDLAPANAGSALSPTAVFNTSTNQVDMSSASSVIWGKSSTWSASVVWGTSVIWGTTTSGQSVLWGASTSCWDSSTSSGFAVIWGSHALWGHSSTTADSVLTGGEK